MKLLLYCCKNKPYLVNKERIEIITKRKDHIWLTGERYAYDNWVNGTIVAECDFEVEEISVTYADYYHEELAYDTNTLTYDELLEKSCLDNQQLDNYLYGDNGYAIHIKNLHIFNKPRELNDFVLLNQYRKDLKGTQYNVLTKAPQNMCKVAYSKSCINKYNFNDFYKGECVLISIRPEWLCKILNGEKTIEVRRKVLKEMIK